MRGLTAIVGWLMVTTGSALVYPPAGLMVGGSLLLLAVVPWNRRR